MIDRNKKLYENKNIKFFYINDLTEKIEHGYLIMIKRCINSLGIKIYKIINTKYKYGFRPLNLEEYPFLFDNFKTIRDMMFCNFLKRIYIKS